MKSAGSAEFLSSDISDALDDANVRPDIHDIDTGPTVKLLPNEDVHENDIEPSTPEGSDLISGKQTVVDSNEKKGKIREASEGTEITRDKVVTELEKGSKTETKSPETVTDSTDGKVAESKEISEEHSKKVKVVGDTKRKKKSSSTDREKIVKTSKEDFKVSKEETEKIIKVPYI